jgi:hydrogenase nickel incorporation protein HypA/HybF
MHEYSVVRALLDRVESEARAQHALRVRRLRVQVGELSGIDVYLLRTAYDACRIGTICAGASLEVVSVATRWSCSRCGRDIPSAGPRRCSECGAPARLTHGEELNLDRIELEVGDV